MQAGIPLKVYHSDAKEHDSLFIQHKDVARKVEVLLFDKAYNNYALFDKWNKDDIFFVTRLKNNVKETLIKEFDLLEATPNEILRDAKIALKYKGENGDENQVQLRLGSYYHKEKNKVYFFLTSLFDLPAEQIALLYKKCWEIELLFTKIKQNFPLQYFYRENKNAIQIQIWCTLIALLLISVMKKKLTRAWSFSNIVSLLPKHLFIYVEFTAFFNNIDSFAQEYVKNKGNPQCLQQKIDFNPS